MGCSSGGVCSLTAMTGGWYVCTIDSGREPRLERRVGLGDGELSSEVGDVACSGSDGGVVAADEDADGGSLARCRVADAEGEGEGVLIEVSGLGACFG